MDDGIEADSKWTLSESVNVRFKSIKFEIETFFLVFAFGLIALIQFKCLVNWPQAFYLFNWKWVDELRETERANERIVGCLH